MNDELKIGDIVSYKGNIHAAAGYCVIVDILVPKPLYRLLYMIKYIEPDKHFTFSFKDSKRRIHNGVNLCGGGNLTYAGKKIDTEKIFDELCL